MTMSMVKGAGGSHSETKHHRQHHTSVPQGSKPKENTTKSGIRAQVQGFPR